MGTRGFSWVICELEMRTESGYYLAQGVYLAMGTRMGSHELSWLPMGPRVLPYVLHHTFTHSKLELTRNFRSKLRDILRFFLWSFKSVDSYERQTIMFHISMKKTECVVTNFGIFCMVQYFVTENLKILRLSPG